jgi:hypothetical protein
MQYSRSDVTRGLADPSTVLDRKLRIKSVFVRLDPPRFRDGILVLPMHVSTRS